MKGRCIFLVTFFVSCASNWVQLPLVSKHNEIKKKSQLLIQNDFCHIQTGNVSTGNVDICSNVHNLTFISYGAVENEEKEPVGGSEISLQDVNDLLKLSQDLPKTRVGRINFLKQIGEKLEAETERRIKDLFPPGAREARTGFHYPSMESALLTISMLLFGVYLTQLILKLLQSHYNRFNGNIGMMTGIRRPIAIGKGRRSRSLSLELKKINLMNLINKYNAEFD